MKTTHHTKTKILGNLMILTKILLIILVFVLIIKIVPLYKYNLEHPQTHYNYSVFDVPPRELIVKANMISEVTIYIWIGLFLIVCFFVLDYLKNGEKSMAYPIISMSKKIGDDINEKR